MAADPKTREEKSDRDFKSFKKLHKVLVRSRVLFASPQGRNESRLHLGRYRQRAVNEKAAHQITRRPPPSTQSSHLDSGYGLAEQRPASQWSITSSQHCQHSVASALPYSVLRTAASAAILRASTASAAFCPTIGTGSSSAASSIAHQFSCVHLRLGKTVPLQPVIEQLPGLESHAESSKTTTTRPQPCCVIRENTNILWSICIRIAS